MVLRNFQSGDDRLFINLVSAAYRNLETLTTQRVKRLLSPPYFEPKGFFIAEEKSKPLGCVGVFNLSAKDRIDLRYLAVNNTFSNTACAGVVK
jgi:N-acetylglutamate synthase-like GNAT family acetyltransferase